MSAIEIFYNRQIICEIEPIVGERSLNIWTNVSILKSEHMNQFTWSALI